jgi:hypothetical protein
VLARLPVRDVVIWNEANSPTFWPTAAGAPAYEALLADCWTTVHRLPRPANVISSTAARHDPAGLIRVPALANGSGQQRVRRDQARQLSDALKLAYCQPAVGALFDFELMDEARLRGWQSAVIRRDGTPKPSYASFKTAIAAVKPGDIGCSTVAGGGS